MNIELTDTKEKCTHVIGATRIGDSRGFCGDGATESNLGAVSDLGDSLLLLLVVLIADVRLLLLLLLFILLFTGGYSCRQYIIRD